jgi:hypothetical protein
MMPRACGAVGAGSATLGHGKNSMRRWLMLLMVGMLPGWRSSAATAQPLDPPTANYVPPPAPTPQQPAAPQLSPLYTRQSVFAIPFKIDEAGSASQRPAAVQLHVSEDGGQSWRLYEQVDPAAGRFTFRAPHDGDFQFFVRTLDSAGRLQPAAPPKAELRVVVDTLAPRLELSAEQAPSGEVAVHWRMLDRHLRHESLKLEFQPRGGNRWQSITIPRPEPGNERTDTGEVTFWPGASAGDIIIRAQVVDQAGNPAVAQSEVVANATNADVRTAASRREEEDTNRLLGDETWQSVDDRPTPGGVRWNQAHAASMPFGQSPPRQEELAPPPAMEDVVPGTELPAVTGPAGQTPPFGTTSTNHSVADDPPAEELGPPREFPSDSNESVSDAPGTSPPTEAGRVAPRSPQFGFDRLPPGEQPRMVNSRRFEIDYEVDALGTVGIAKVELYGTRDWGQTWVSFGYDNDNRTPFTVVVDQEGMYGFRIVVETANGLGGLPPRGGDRPDVWVAVDLTKPTVRLVAVEEVQDGPTAALRIRWDAEDSLLATNPITIAYAERASGPWTSIAEAIDNSGEYLWRIDRRLPDQIYLQVQARDEAGNVAVASSAEPVSLARLRPQGRIREIRPARESVRNPSWTIRR